MPDSFHRAEATVRPLQSDSDMEARKSPAPPTLDVTAGLVVLAGLALVLAGVRCSQLASVFERPDLEFRGIRVNSVGLEGASLELVVDVFNPNWYRLGVERFSHDLSIENVPWAVGSSETPIAVEGRDTATIVLPLTISWTRLGEAGRRRFAAAASTTGFPER